MVPKVREKNKSIWEGDLTNLIDTDIPTNPSLPLVSGDSISLADENVLAGYGEMSPGFGR